MRKYVFLCVAVVLQLSLAEDSLSLWENMPPGYENPVIVKYADIKYVEAILAEDLIKVFPRLEGKYKTALEKEEFAKSAEAESLSQIIREEKTKLLQNAYLVKLKGDQSKKSKVEEYDLEKKGFVVFVTFHEGNEHIYEGVWFNNLPIKVYYLPFGYVGDYEVEHYYDGLLLKMDKKTALDIERQREDLEVWIGFKISSELKKQKEMILGKQMTFTYVKAKDEVVMLVNTSEKEVVWWKKYFPPAKKKK